MKYMNTWNYLREFESKELIKRYVPKKFGYVVNNDKALEITSAFIQGREYFTSYAKADISVKPLLLYYGIVALSRALILILNKDTRECRIVPQHGLKINNSYILSKTKNLEDIKLKVSSGTFLELIKATKNITFIRHQSSGVKMRTGGIWKDEFEFNLKELAFCFPDLKESVSSWLNLEVNSRKFNTITVDTVSFSQPLNSEIFKALFPDDCFPNLSMLDNGKKVTYSQNHSHVLNICQSWDGPLDIGEGAICPVFEGRIYINDISKMYAASFVFATLSRYHPSTWNNIIKGITNDSILPFSLNLMDLIETKFPVLIQDFITNNMSGDIIP